MSKLNQTEHDALADLLLAYAENVQENLDDDMRDHDEEMDGEPNDEGHWPVVEDYQADADRIRMGETPLHELTREVLLDPTGVIALADDELAAATLVARLLG